MIISCSRRTDIPAFYSGWFFNRLREGFVEVRNPVNPRQVRKISLAPADVDCFVFWTKNPAPMLNRLDRLERYNFYFQFTLTPYGRNIEPHLPPKTQIIDAFCHLSNRIGKKRIIWRYDPVIFSEEMNVEYHAEQFARLAGRLAGYTEKCVISFLDAYRHIQNKMSACRVRMPDEAEMRGLAKAIAEIAAGHRMKVETCAEAIDLADIGVEHGKCIDDRLISELTGVHLKREKDRHQREHCGCVTSVDIGDYNTCGHLCKYCYANVSPQKVERNRPGHDTRSPLLIGAASDMENKISTTEHQAALPVRT
ncbi:MAG TPA: DUF1848 domain-containing protein [Smithella sp.]|nr:DUF1848 domain-containing protein [Smithella sp.]